MLCSGQEIDSGTNLNFQFETKHTTAKPKQTFKEKKENEEMSVRVTGGMPGAAPAALWGCAERSGRAALSALGKEKDPTEDPTEGIVRD